MLSVSFTGIGEDIANHIPVLEAVFRHAEGKATPVHFVDMDSSGDGDVDTTLVPQAGLREAEFVGLLAKVSLPCRNTAPLQDTRMHTHDEQWSRCQCV